MNREGCPRARCCRWRWHLARGRGDRDPEREHRGRSWASGVEAQRDARVLADRGATRRVADCEARLVGCRVAAPSVAVKAEWSELLCCAGSLQRRTASCRGVCTLRRDYRLESVGLVAVVGRCCQASPPSLDSARERVVMGPRADGAPAAGDFVDVMTPPGARRMRPSAAAQLGLSLPSALSP